MSYKREYNYREDLIALAEQAKDEGDISQLLSFYEEEKRKEQIALLNQPETHPDFDGKNCIDCAYEIPKERLEMKKIRCVDCQQELEDYRKRRQRV